MWWLFSLHKFRTTLMTSVSCQKRIWDIVTIQNKLYPNTYYLPNIYLILIRFAFNVYSEKCFSSKGHKWRQLHIYSCVQFLAKFLNTFLIEHSSSLVQKLSIRKKIVTCICVLPWAGNKLYILTFKFLNSVFSTFVIPFSSFTIYLCYSYINYISTKKCKRNTI